MTHVAGMGEKTNTILFWVPERNTPFERPRCGQEDNIKVSFILCVRIWTGFIQIGMVSDTNGGRREKHTVFEWRNQSARDDLEVLGADGIQMILEKHNRRGQRGFICLRWGTSGGLL